VVKILVFDCCLIYEAVLTDNKNDGNESEDNPFVTKAGKLATQSEILFSEASKVASGLSTKVSFSFMNSIKRILKHEKTSLKEVSSWNILNIQGFVKCLDSHRAPIAELAIFVSHYSW
jgi:hypothetical protein